MPDPTFGEDTPPLLPIPEQPPMDDAAGGPQAEDDSADSESSTAA